MSRALLDPPLNDTDAVLVGGCRVVRSLREIQCPGGRRPTRVTPKAMAVLQLLLENPGRVVTREELLARVWPGTFPTDDVVTQAITQLRKAFGQPRGEPRFIETIAKNGYRLVAPVEAVPEPHPAADPVGLRGGGTEQAGEVSEPVSPPRHRGAFSRVTFSWVGTLGVLLLGGALGWWLGVRDPGRQEALPMQPMGGYRFLTAAPGFELSPSLSPNGAQVAYAAARPGERNSRIFVQDARQVSPRPLNARTGPFADSLPVWSPNGREIAFVRRGASGDCSIVRASTAGGAEIVVAPCNADDIMGFDWTPDGRALLFGSVRGVGGLRMLNLATGVWRALDYGAGPNALDRGPRFSPDGKWVLFAREPQFGDLWRVPAEGGEAQRLTRRSGELRGWDWMPDGRRVVLSRRVGNESRLFVLDPATGEEADLGIDDAQSPDVAPAANALVFIRRRPDFGLFRMDRSPSSGAWMKSPEFESSGRDAQPVLSPDGKQMVFNSDRSGHFHLWWVALQRPASLRAIDMLHPDGQRVPAWSPDSRSLLLVATDHDGRLGLHEIQFPEGRATRLPVPLARPAMALYTRQSHQILVLGGEAQGPSRLQLFDRSVSPWKVLATIDDVSLAQADLVGGRLLFTRTSSDGLWQSDLSLSPGSIRRIDPDLPARERYRMWALAPDGTVAYIDRTADCLTRIRGIAGGGWPAYCISEDARATTTGFSIAPDGGSLHIALARSDGTDIGLLPLTR